MSRVRKPAGFDPKLCRSLRHYQRNPHLVPAAQLVRIWSNEHRLFWRAGITGYTEDPTKAELVTAGEAYRVTSHCGPEKQIWFVALADQKGRSA